jgi:hypothetical protein
MQRATAAVAHGETVTQKSKTPSIREDRRRLIRVLSDPQLSGDTREEQREDQKGFYESNAEEHRGEDLARSAWVTGDAVEGGGNDFALAESATESGDAYGEAFGESVHWAALSNRTNTVFSESHCRSCESYGGG